LLILSWLKIKRAANNSNSLPISKNIVLSFPFIGKNQFHIIPAANTIFPKVYDYWQETGRLISGMLLEKQLYYIYLFG
jgi:hypothetical protein